MRLIATILTMALILAILGFVLTNPATVVAVKVWSTVHDGVPLWLIVLFAIVAGIVYAGGIAIVEGAAIRIANRNLEREVQRLETELTYLRTQPASHRRPEPDVVDATGDALAAPSAGAIHEGDPVHPAAPVYEGESPETSTDPDDDAYSGRRAV